MPQTDSSCPSTLAQPLHASAAAAERALSPDDHPQPPPTPRLSPPPSAAAAGRPSVAVGGGTGRCLRAWSGGARLRGGRTLVGVMGSVGVDVVGVVAAAAAAAACSFENDTHGVDRPWVLALRCVYVHMLLYVSVHILLIV